MLMDILSTDLYNILYNYDIPLAIWGGVLDPSIL